jgi:hypothetical protein
METKLIKYIRNEKGEPRGVVMAIRQGNEVFYGYSLCNPKDRWNRKMGLKIAEARAIAGSYELPKIKKSLKIIEDAFYHLSNRAMNYFKDLPKDDVYFEFND